MFFLGQFDSFAQKQFVWNAKVQSIYESITSMRIPEAKKMLQQEKITNPNNLCIPLLENYTDLYVLFFNENISEFNSIYPDFDKRLALFKESNPNTPFYLYSQALVHLSVAVSSFRFEKNLDAAINFRKSYMLLKRNQELYPGFAPNDMYFGLMTTIIGSVPKNFQWIMNIIGLRGSISKGNAMVYNYITKKSEYGSICRNEALLIYPYLVTVFEGNKKKALDFIENGDYDFVKNHLHAYMATNLYLSNQHAQKALGIANGIDKSDAYLQIPFWHYEKGFAYLNQLDLDNAQNEFLKFVQTFKGQFYVKDAYEKLSWISFIKNDFKTASAYRQKVLALGSEVTDADKAAASNAKAGHWPNPMLLKARLLSDGGLQSQALALLHGRSSNDFSEIVEKTEFVYRVARIYDLMGNKEQAIRFYKLSIEQGRHLKEYFASRSALQLGQIYEDRKDFANATIYYSTCLELKNVDYKNSLDQKAKSGLQRCKGVID